MGKGTLLMGQDHEILRKYRAGQITKTEAIVLLARMPGADWAIKDLELWGPPTQAEHYAHRLQARNRAWKSLVGVSPDMVASYVDNFKGWCRSKYRKSLDSGKNNK